MALLVVAASEDQRPSRSSIAGRARHAGAGSPAGVLILARHLELPLRMATLTSASGAFELSNAPDGRYAVSAALAPSDTVTVTVSAGRPARADVTVRRA
jgi:hypothetical protein